MIQGDVNAKVARGLIDESRPADDNLSSWTRKHDLHLVEFEDGLEAATFVTNSGPNDPPCRRQLDVCLVSAPVVFLFFLRFIFNLAIDQ